MHVEFTVEQLKDPNFEQSHQILTKCLQCGYCLDNCPTYQETGEEYDSPRGRTFLVRQMLESNQSPNDETVHYLDRCLTCLNCMSSCPSFVHYLHLMDHARDYIEQHYKRPPMDRMIRWSLAHILPYPDRFRSAVRGAQLAKPLAPLMPRKLRRLIETTPDTLPPKSANDQPRVFHAIGKRTHRVALLNGCVQQAINTDINDASIRLLTRHGCEVVIPEGAGCCGALTYHMGKIQDSLPLAEANIKSWTNEIDQQGLDAIVINTSGCGTVVKDYGHMFRHHPLAEQAESISSITKDISELLLDLKLDFQRKPSLRVAYHASCSLQFGQRIRFAPKKLLKTAGFTVVEPRQQHTCCGSAGTYNLLQPEMSDTLKQKKVSSLEALSPQVIAAGNIGCMKQIGGGTDIPVVHSVELLDWVTGGPTPSPLAQIESSSLISG